MDAKEMLDLFLDTPRQGNVYDDPEGTRYLCISETVAEQIIVFLRTMIENEPVDEVEESGEAEEIVFDDQPAEPKVLFFDTETSGFMSKDKTAYDPDQAWCIQIGAILSDSETIYDKMNVIIKSNGRSINPHAEKVHGISTRKADDEGIDELKAVNQFGSLLRQADLIVCHNHSFDWPYVYQMMQRNLDDMSDEARSAFYLDLPAFCTMKDKRIVNFCGLKNKANRIKWPKLEELHQTLFGEGFDDAHDAFADITATRNCYYGLISRNIIE